jgi:hypothetical protein
VYLCARDGNIKTGRFFRNYLVTYFSVFSSLSVSICKQADPEFPHHIYCEPYSGILQASFRFYSARRKLHGNMWDGKVLLLYGAFAYDSIRVTGADSRVYVVSL